MKIAHVITRLIIGGAQENTLLTCEGLQRSGHAVTLIAGPETGPEGTLWPRAEAGAYRKIKVASLQRGIQPMAEWRARRALTRIFHSEGFDVVHTHSSKAGILGRMAARRAGVPLVVHTIHGMSFNRTQPAPVRALYRFLERRVAGSTDAFISVADAMTAQAVAAGIAPRERFSTIRSGIETERFKRDAGVRAEVRGAWGVSDDRVVVGTVARLFRNKGYESIIAALPAIVAAHPDVHFVWVGDGKDRDAYEAAVARLGLGDRLTLTGLVPPEEIPRLLNGFDIILHASRWEGLARVLVQAALTQVPAVTFDLDGAREVIEHDVTGRLVPAEYPRALAVEVAALAADAATRRRLGEAGEARCRTAFSHQRMVEAIERLYARLVREGPVHSG